MTFYPSTRFHGNRMAFVSLGPSGSASRPWDWSCWGKSPGCSCPHTSCTLLPPPPWTWTCTCTVATPTSSQSQPCWPRWRPTHSDWAGGTGFYPPDGPEWKVRRPACSSAAEPPGQGGSGPSHNFTALNVNKQTNFHHVAVFIDKGVKHVRGQRSGSDPGRLRPSLRQPGGGPALMMSLPASDNGQRLRDNPGSL